MIFRHRSIWYTLSLLLIGASAVFIGFFGLPLGIDFTGGNLVEIQPATAETSIQSVKEGLGSGGVEAVVQKTADGTLLVKYAARADGTLPTAQDVSSLLPGAVVVRSSSIGPAMGESLQSRALLSIAVASLGIILYLAWSFRGVGKLLSTWSFGSFAVVALLHDVFITTGFITLLSRFNAQITIDTYFVTALLTILAYSVNDTIVVYDRVREVLWQDPSLPLPIAIERSVQQTASRSLNTSLAIVLAVLPLILLAGGSLLTFLLTLAFGIVIGTYSSIFLAAPLLGTWRGWRSRPRRAKRPRRRRTRRN